MDYPFKVSFETISNSVKRGESFFFLKQSLLISLTFDPILSRIYNRGNQEIKFVILISYEVV